MSFNHLNHLGQVSVLSLAEEKIHDSFKDTAWHCFVCSRVKRAESALWQPLEQVYGNGKATQSNENNANVLSFEQFQKENEKQLDAQREHVENISNENAEIEEQLILLKQEKEQLTSIPEDLKRDIEHISNGNADL